jgi:hypothetical protein
VDGTDLESHAPRSLALPPETELKDLSTLETRPLAKVPLGSVFWTRGDGTGRGALFLPPGARVHESVAKSNPQVAATLQGAVGSGQRAAGGNQDREVAPVDFASRVRPSSHVTASAQLEAQSTVRPARPSRWVSISSWGFSGFSTTASFNPATEGEFRRWRWPRTRAARSSAASAQSASLLHCCASRRALGGPMG